MCPRHQPWQPMTRQTYARRLAFVERCRAAAPPEAAEAAEEGERPKARQAARSSVLHARHVPLGRVRRKAIEELAGELADATHEFEEATPWRASSQSTASR